jgi:AraC-like DNA-binding protein
MIYCRHIPRGPIATFVDWFWFYEGFLPDHRREHVLPEGTFELVIDLRETPRKLFDRADASRFDSFRRGWISGTHSEYIVIDALPDSSMIGVHFKPGGMAPFLGLPSDELTDRVVEMDAVWGRSADELRERLLSAPDFQAKFLVLESFLLARMARHSERVDRRERIPWALEQFLRQPDQQRIRAVADQLGISHKHFISEFRRQVGLTPKLFCRIRRFQQVLAQINSHSRIEWADVAYSCGYYDQAHFVNDFQAFAGVNPSSYLNHRLVEPNFVPVVD